MEFCNLQGKRRNGYILLEVESSKGLECEADVEITQFKLESSTNGSRRRQSIMTHIYLVRAYISLANRHVLTFLNIVLCQLFNWHRSIALQR